MKDMPTVLLPRESEARIRGWGGSWGFIDYQFDVNEDLFVVTGSSKQNVRRIGTDAPPWSNEHYLAAPSVHSAGFWYRVQPEGVAAHHYAAARGLRVKTEALKDFVIGGWHHLPVEPLTLIVTWCVIEDEVLFAAWWANSDDARPAFLHLVEDRDALSFLAPAWPVAELADEHVTVVGIGSIGASAAATLARVGITRMALVDDDRLLEHNVARHELSRRHLGRYKVTGLAEELRGRYPDIHVEPLRLNVIDDADEIRALLQRTAIVLCATDGVASRRVTNHLARKAGVPAVFVCVLEDGAFGEIVRVKPGTGCLLCLRESLRSRGSMDPEPRIDRGYGTGSRHRPMTAAPGDLRVMSDLAAKAVVATLLKRRGHAEQELAGDHAVIGLRPIPGRPQPFDLERCGELRWSDIGPSYPDCVTCGVP